MHLPGAGTQHAMKSLPFLVVLVLPLLLVASCKRQAPVDSEPETRVRDSAQIDAYVVAAFEDEKGGLWFGTNGQGVARWNGEALTYFSIGEGLIDDVVTGIAEDRSGQLWFGTQAGASRFDGKTFTGFGPEQGLPGAGCKLLVDRNGGVWAGTSAGVFRLAGDRFVPFALPTPSIEALSYKIAPGKVWDLLEDRSGNLWFGRDGYGACKFDGTTFTHFTKKDGLCSDNVASIAEDARGNIWFGSITSDHPRYLREGGVCRYDGTTFTRFPEVVGLTANDVYNIFTDRAGNVWIGAIGVGAYRVDGASFTLFDQTDRPDLTQNFAIQSFVEDRRGTLWFGFSGGLFRFNGNGFTNVTRGGPWSGP